MTEGIERYRLSEGAHLELHRGFLGSESAREAFERLLETLDWEQHAVTLFGRSVMQPRLIAWAGELPYRYSGLTLAPRAPSPALVDIGRRVSAHTSGRFNHVLLNRYRDGSDHMGWHADDEPELGPSPRVACLSLGQTRQLRFKPRSKTSSASYCLTLDSGDLLVMGPGVQSEFLHCLPKRKRAGGERLSLTYRTLIRSPAPRRCAAGDRFSGELAG